MIISFKWSQNLCERSLYSKYSFSHITHIIQCNKVTLGIHIDMRWIYIPRKVQGQRYSFKVTGKVDRKFLFFFLEKWFFWQSPSPLSDGIDLWWCEYEISFFPAVFYTLAMSKVNWSGHNISPVIYSISILQYHSC